MELTAINKYTQQFERYKIEYLNVFIALLLCTLFFLPINSFWFTLSISIMFGCLYYLLCETQPQFMMILEMIIGYQLTRASKWLSGPFKSDCKPDSTFRLNLKDNFNSLIYEDYIKVANKNKRYIYLFPEKFRSNDLIIFRDAFDTDITDYIEPFLGPMQNFHGVPFTPVDFNFKQIKVFRDGEICLSKTFEENEVITLSS
jgi:hypothetical protein